SCTICPRAAASPPAARWPTSTAGGWSRSWRRSRRDTWWRATRWTRRRPERRGRDGDGRGTSGGQRRRGARGRRTAALGSCRTEAAFLHRAQFGGAAVWQESAPRARRGRRRPDGLPGRDGGAGGRVGLRQVDAGPQRAAALSAHGRVRQIRGSGNFELAAGGDAAAAEGYADYFPGPVCVPESPDRKSTRLNSSHVKISYAVFCLNKKNIH